MTLEQITDREQQLWEALGKAKADCEAKLKPIRDEWYNVYKQKEAMEKAPRLASELCREIERDA